MKKEFDYRPAPFYFLNDRLTEDEIEKQMPLLKKSGISGFFIHPRCGNTVQPYASDEWFEMVGRIIKRAEELGLKAWLYDEDPFPSGQAGGRVVCDYPELKARSLKIAVLEPDENLYAEAVLGDVKVLSVYAVKTDEKGNIAEKINMSGSFGMVRQNWHKFMHNSSYYCDLIEVIAYEHPRSETFNPEVKVRAKVKNKDYKVYAAYTEIQSTGDKFFYRPDNLNKKTVELFIEYTHEKYKERFGDRFGGVIPGIFTDEPVPGGLSPYTERLEEEFFKEKGYKLSENYMHLAETFGEISRKIRLDYWQVVEKLYNKNCFGTIKKWCRKNKILFTGHILCEEDPFYQALAGGNVYSALWNFDIPGFDIVGNILGDRNHIALAFGAKLASSVAHQKNIKQVMCECFACNPFNFGAGGMMKISGWLFSLGINWLVPHGFFYGYGGMRKFDAGKSLFFQDPEFKDFPRFAEYAGRVGRMLAEGAERANVCLIIPTYEFYGFSPCEREKMLGLRKSLFSAVKNLIENHIEFDVTDCNKLLCSEASGGKFKIGARSYENAVVVTAQTGFLNEVELKLKNADVRVFKAGQDGGLDIRELKKHAVYTDLTVVYGESANVFCYSKDIKDGRLIYLFNNSPKPCAVKTGAGAHKYCYVYDAQNDLYMSLAHEKVSMRGYEAVITLTVNNKRRTDGDYEYREYNGETVYGYDVKPQWEYTPPSGAEEIIAAYDLTVTGASGDTCFKGVKYGRLRDYYGTADKTVIASAPQAGFDKAPRISDIYPVKAVFRTVFQRKTGKTLLFEEETFLGKCSIVLNGKQVKKIVPERVYDFTNLAADVSGYIVSGNNELVITFESAGEWDGINSAVYLIK